ncbi:hypothetical protein [Flavobacterium sp.]|uniref:hypothetical protein n=1 Tax=Flavobacterium sp. TaxID=239 RepID=UPI0031D9F2A8
MATNINTILGWFKTGYKPTQAQFWSSWQSFWHKDEIIPQSSIANLEETLNIKIDKLYLDEHKIDKNAHKNLFDEKENKSQRGIPNGYVPLDTMAKITSNYLNIVNDLNSGGINSLLSAEQGKILQNQINSINDLLESDNISLNTIQKIVNYIEDIQVTLSSFLVNDLTTGGACKALTAEMGKILNDIKLTASIATDNETQIDTNIEEDNKIISRSKLFKWFEWIKMRPQSISGTWTFTESIKAHEATMGNQLTTLDQVKDIAKTFDVSQTVSGIVNNSVLQELGGVDKTINGVRIGRGASNINSNTALGLNAMDATLSGGSNTSVGAFSGLNLSTGASNTLVGRSAGSSITTSTFNTFIGSSAGALNTGSSNVLIGASSGRYGASNNNIAIGTSALLNNTGTPGSEIFGHKCIAIGSSAMEANQTGHGIAIGTLALTKQTTCMWNIALGTQAGAGITTGSGNVIIADTGFVTAGGGITTGNNNLIVAPNSGNTTGITIGSGNVVLGKVSGLAANAIDTITISDGSGNIALNKTSLGELKAPNLTQALIISGGDKSLINKGYIDQMGSVINTTTTALSVTNLNSTYPNAISLRVHCLNIASGGIVYEKSGSGWIQYSASPLI